jgi:hypothetical protein
VLGYQCFGGPYYLHLQGEVVFYHNTTQHYVPDDDLNLHHHENLKSHTCLGFTAETMLAPPQDSWGRD